MDAKSNPFAAANRRAQEERERARREKEAEEWRQKQAEEAAERQRKREEARLERERRVMEQTKARLAEHTQLVEDELRQRREREAALREEQRQAELRRKQEEEEQRRQEERQRQQAERDRQEAEERARRERENARRLAEEKRLADLREAEKLAEERAERITLQRRIEAALTEAVEVSALAAAEATTARNELRTISLPAMRLLLQNLEINIEAKKREAAAVRKKQAADDDEALGFEEEPSRSAKNDDRADGFEGLDEDHKEKSKLQLELEAAESALAGKVAAEDIAKSLQSTSDVGRRAAAVVALQRLLIQELSQGTQHFQEKLQSGFGAWTARDIIAPLADMVTESPANLPALLCMGMLAFAGHAGTYRLIYEQNAIPPAVDDWVGAVLGLRMYFEYVNWLERRKEVSTLAWAVGAEKDVGHLKLPERDQEARQKQAAAARSKIKELVTAYGLAEGPVPSKEVETHVDKIAAKFDFMALSLLGSSSKVAELKMPEAELKKALDLRLQEFVANEEQLRRSVEEQKSEIRRLETSKTDMGKQIEEQQQSIQTAEQLLAEIQKNLEKTNQAMAQIDEQVSNATVD